MCEPTLGATIREHFLLKNRRDHFVRWLRSRDEHGQSMPEANTAAPDRMQVVDAATVLYRAHGFRAVSLSDVARALGVTDDDIRANFCTEVALFEAVYVRELHNLGSMFTEDFGSPDPAELMSSSLDSWLDAMKDPGLRQVVILDAPDALGWDSWRRSGDRYDRILMEATLSDAMDKGVVPDQPVRPLGHVLSGAMESGIYYAVQQDDPAAAIDEVREALHVLLKGMLAFAPQHVDGALNGPAPSSETA